MDPSPILLSAQRCVYFHTKGIDNQPLIFINSVWTVKLQGLTVIQEENKTGESFDSWVTRENWCVRKKSFMFIHDKEKKRIMFYSFKHAAWQRGWHGGRSSVRWLLSSSGCLIGGRGDVLWLEFVSPSLIQKHSSSDTSQIIAVSLFAQLINCWEWKIKVLFVSFHSELGLHCRSPIGS